MKKRYNANEINKASLVCRLFGYFTTEVGPMANPGFIWVSIPDFFFRKAINQHHMILAVAGMLW